MLAEGKFLDALFGLVEQYVSRERECQKLFLLAESKEVLMLGVYQGIHKMGQE